MHGMAGSNMPAIVLARGYTALGMLRSLVDAGIPAYVACPRGDLVTRSRWYRPVPGAYWDGSLGEQGLALLRDCPLREAVVLPGADDAALWVGALPQHPDLAGRFRVSSSPVATLALLQDKSRLAETLQEIGVPKPHTFRISCAGDIASIPFETLDRVFVKPADSQAFNQMTGRKGVWANGRVEFEEVWRGLDARGLKVVAQEYVPGGADDHYFVDGFRDADGAFRGLFARRRLRIDPPDFGNSSYCESIPLDAVSTGIDALSQLFRHVAFRGMFSAEFKRDARDGQLRLLEVNTRAWWYVEFAARCGVNVCRMAYEDALGRPVADAGTYRQGAGCVNMLGDIKAVAARSGRRLPPASVLGQWLRAERHVFRIDDPGPGMRLFLQALRAWFARVASQRQRAVPGDVRIAPRDA